MNESEIGHGQRKRENPALITGFLKGAEESHERKKQQLERESGVYKAGLRCGQAAV